MSNELMRMSDDSISKLALAGDVSILSAPEKIQYYKSLCERLGVDPATQPFKLLKLQGKEVFYCDRGGCQQLSRIHGVSHAVVAREVTNDCYVVTARASTPTRSSESIGAVPVKGLQGEALCNAYMKAETKAKRRATLDLLGLGMLDETEVDTIPGVTTAAIQPVARIPDAPIAATATPRPAARPTAKPPTTVATDDLGGDEWNTVLHFGKNKGKTLRDLDSNSLSWYMSKWEPTEWPAGSGRFSEADVRLRTALNQIESDRAGQIKRVAAEVKEGPGIGSDEPPF